ncbi:hypothetical protein BDV95DRAFT_599573 [Massariosphaeria phaeospora]|uniref:F-box domain-containing protein n=1 Tax=Massariosphaeria phaeospora TaxID=100035 RepID=A0A7C8I5F0_9PLEO|nr:hypothetical protein BDV95DRAFT_599573 [Massariosphaeria phaeospora]
MAILPSMAGFFLLPTELKISVFAQIALVSDRKNVRLVCRQWADMMDPILWEILKTDLRPTAAKTMKALVKQHGRTLPHVRELHLSVKPLVDDTIKNKLHQVLLDLPKYRLRTFRSNVMLGVHTVQLILSTQRYLKVFDAVISPYYPSKSRPYKDIASSLSCLSQLRRLSLSVLPAANDHCNYQTFYEYFPKLEELELYNFSPEVDETEDSTSHVNLVRLLPQNADPPALQTLAKITIRSMRFPTRPTVRKVFLRHLNIANLTNLTLHSCINMAPFLNAVAQSFARGCSSSLQVLDIQFYPDDDDDDDDNAELEATERLLDAFTGLKDLRLEMPRGHLVRQQCIARHKTSLEILGVYTRLPDPAYYSVPDLSSLLNACTKIHTLRLNLPPLLVGKVEHLGKDFCLRQYGSISADTELEAFLVSQAALPCIDPQEFTSSAHRPQTTLSHFPSLYTLVIDTAPTLDSNGAVLPAHTIVGDTVSFADTVLAQMTVATLKHFRGEICDYMRRQGCMRRGELDIRFAMPTHRVG